MKGWRPSEWGEAPLPSDTSSYHTPSKTCGFEGCTRARSFSGAKKTRVHRYCGAHMKQKGRGGIASMKPINEALSAANKAAYLERKKHAS